VNQPLAALRPLLAPVLAQRIQQSKTGGWTTVVGQKLECDGNRVNASTNKSDLH